MAGDWCDGFLQLKQNEQQIKGESTDKVFAGAIEILSFKFGSMSGFSDSEEIGNDASIDLGWLFGGEDAAPELSDKKPAENQGTDLADVEACGFQIVKEMDLSSPDLFRAYCSSQDLENREVFDSGTITLRKATGGARAPFLTYVFSDLVVTGYSLEVSGDASPKETINLSFAKVRAEYYPQKASGEMDKVIKGGWDFIERTTFS